MKCINCGKELIPGARFCTGCGSVQPESIEQTGQTVQAQPADMYTDRPEEQAYYQQPQEQSYYQQPQEQANYQQPGQYDYNGQQYAAPKKDNKKKTMLIIMIVAAVLVVAGGVLAIIFGVRSCTKYNRSSPRASMQTIVNAFNDSNSKELYNSVPPAYIKLMKDYLSSNFRNNTGDALASKMLFTDSNEPEQELFDAADASLRLLHKKVDCKLAFDVTNERQDGSVTYLTGQVTVGSVNVGEATVGFSQENGNWYINIQATGNDSGNFKKLDSNKLKEVFKDFLPYYLASESVASESKYGYLPRAHSSDESKYGYGSDYNDVPWD